MLKSFNQLTISKAIIVDNLSESDLIIWKDLEIGLRFPRGWGGKSQAEGRYEIQKHRKEILPV